MPRPPRFASRPRDLDIDFTDADRVSLACRLVAASYDIDAAEVLSWTLGRRLRALAAIASATLGDSLTWETHCSAPSCRQPMELELPLGAFLAGAEEAAAFEYAERAGACLGVRVPTGWDQLAWRTLAGPPENLPLAMAGSLVTSLNGHVPEPGWRLPADWLDGLEAQLAARDPGSVTATPECPSCGTRRAMAIDMETVILDRLEQEQRRAIEDVHRLARAYHWHEAEVLAIPPRRRTLYLQRSLAEP